MATKRFAPGAGRVISIKPVTSWSYSRYGDYKTCPLKFKLKHVDRIKEPGSPAMDRGNERHKDAEAYIKGQVAKLHPELAPLKDELAKLRKMYKNKKLPMVVEDNWAFKADWSETAWDDWAECWVRIKLDCAHYEAEGDAMVMYITDWKTGQPSDYKVVEYMEQLELYALAGLLMSQFPDVVVRPRIGWLDAGMIYDGASDQDDTPIQYTRADIPKLKKAWAARVKPMFADKTYAPKSNALCKWCYFGQSGKAKGGPGLCKY